MMKNPEHHFEAKDQYRYPYDVVIVLGGGLNKVGETYVPTDYRHGDQFGMLGAGMRMASALELYFQKQAKNFVFATGVTEKNKSVHGSDVPTEAEVYKEKFLRSLEGLKKRSDYKEKFKNVEEPEIRLEDRSFNTLSNIIEVLQIIKEKGWKKVAIISSDYHIPRIKALYTQALEQHAELQVEVQFLSAEHIVKDSQPGKYDEVIDRAYGSDDAKKRIENETKGLEDIRSGKYAVGEFQLEERKGQPKEK